MADLIDRRAAMDAIADLYWMDERLLNFKREINAVYDKILNLPSAQPEPLTDKEQRIFLAAIGREMEVCKQVDDECRSTREPYEDSLVRVCKEIERKVKKALWT